MLRPEPPVPSALRPTCRKVFGAGSTSLDWRGGEPVLEVALPVLEGAAEEPLLPAGGTLDTRHGCVVFDHERETAGFALAASDAGLETGTRELYRQIFAATRGRHLYRIWNYVPRINAASDDLENYRRFCRGRSVAFEEWFGPGYQRRLPAASAVGPTVGPLAVAFLAGDAAPRHFENPRQVPAFEYPADYGPRPPSFSRATLVGSSAARQLFVSGTAAIRGHATIAAHDLAGQLACTRENFQIIVATAGATVDIGARHRWQQSLKVYLRHATDLLQVRDDLERHLLGLGDAVTYLQADLCRADLLVEIEAVLTRP